MSSENLLNRFLVLEISEGPKVVQRFYGPFPFTIRRSFLPSRASGTHQRVAGPLYARRRCKLGSDSSWSPSGAPFLEGDQPGPLRLPSREGLSEVYSDFSRASYANPWTFRRPSIF